MELTLESVSAPPIDPTIYSEPRWCSDCGGRRMFEVVYECEVGRVGVCLGCGEEKLVRWTRTNSEAA